MVIQLFSRRLIMGQVTIQLDDELENSVHAAARSANLSKSQWIANLIRDKIAEQWIRSVSIFAGSWRDLHIPN
jgi:predicted transcriptional regulator